MKNPFPGMNPFIEGYKWPPFHISMIIYMQEALIGQLPEGFLLEAETTLYIDDGDHQPIKPSRRPDISIVKDAETAYGKNETTITLTPPTTSRARLPIKVRTLEIRDLKTQELVTAIELLSPANKRGEGLNSYRNKRRELELSGVNLVEIDLLRGGKRPDLSTTSEAAYLVQVFNAFQDQMYEWSVGLLETLPTIPVPLRANMDPMVLNLQAVFDKTFELSSFPRSLKYEFSELRPTLKSPEQVKQMEAFITNIAKPAHPPKYPFS